MLQFSKQWQIATSVYVSFTNGVKTNVRYLPKVADKDKRYLNPSKYEQYTQSNFILICLYAMFQDKPKSKIELFNTLSNYTKEDIVMIMNFKSILGTKEFNLGNDELAMKETNLSPYMAYKRQKVSLYYVNKYYNEHPDEIQGRIMKKDLESISVLLSFIA